MLYSQVAFAGRDSQVILHQVILGKVFLRDVWEDLLCL